MGKKTIIWWFSRRYFYWINHFVDFNLDQNFVLLNSNIDTARRMSAQTDSISSNGHDNATIEKVDSKWTSHFFTAEICESFYTFRVLKMNQSVFIYIGQLGNELLDELAMAVPVDDFTSTTILGTLYGCDSQELAQQFTKRLKKQVFVSCNIPSNNTVRLLLVKRIAEEIKNVPDAFWFLFPHWNWYKYIFSKKKKHNFGIVFTW